MKHLLVLVPFRPHHLERIAAATGDGWEIRAHACGLAGDALAEALEWADVVIGEPDGQTLLDHGDGVELLQMTWAGTDQYTRSPLPFPANTKLCNAVGGFGPIISQYVLAQTLSIMQNLPAYRAEQLAGRWSDLGGVGALFGATVLIFGAGSIGSETAARMASFGVHAIGVCQDTSKPRAGFEGLCTLEEAEGLLHKADVVVGCLPNNDDTAGWFDERRLRLMKPGAILVNVGRGTFVDGDALARVLADGHLRGAALDVTNPEPLPQGHPLWAEPRCVITPHTSGGSFGRHAITEDRICDICCENLRRFAAGEPLMNEVRF